jgi:hypothetical protein
MTFTEISRTADAKLRISDQSRRMAFTLVDSSGANRTEFGDKASYSFNQAGFLVVVTDVGVRMTYAHGAWHHIEDTPKGGGW